LVIKKAARPTFHLHPGLMIRDMSLNRGQSVSEWYMIISLAEWYI